MSAEDAQLVFSGSGMVFEYISEHLDCQVTRQYLRESLKACICNGADSSLGGSPQDRDYV